MPKAKSSEDFLNGKTACFTCYDLDKFTVPDTHKHFRYCVYQVEVCPKTKNIHIQGYIEFNSNIKRNTLVEICGGSKLRFFKRNGRADQARHYCMCPGSECGEDHISKDHKNYKQDKIIYAPPIEFGTWNGKSGEQGKRSDLDTFAEAVRSGKKDWELADQFPKQYLLHSSRIHALRSAVKPTLRDPPKVTVIWGDTGLGKTYQAYSTYPIEDIFKIEGKYEWFNGYQQQPVVIFDEFRSQIQISYLLQLLDRYPMDVPVKGSFTPWKPVHIYITSNINPDLWYPNVSPASKAALKRRITEVIHMTDPNVVKDDIMIYEINTS